MKKLVLIFSVALTSLQAQINPFGNTFSNPSSVTNANNILGSTNTMDQGSSNSWGCFISGWGNVLSGTNAHQIHIFGAQNTISTSGLVNSFILGSNSTLSQSNAFAIGNYCTTSGLGAFSMGNYCISSGQSAMAFGTFLNATAANAFIIGSGLSNNFATNSTANSLLVSFNNPSTTTRPTFFVTAPNTGNASTWDDYGTVGIGTNDTKGHTLGVRGDIIAEKMQVALYSLPWPDYVFNKTYELKPLDKVEKFITENKHLPDVPSAETIQTKGYDLADMDAVLLKKIEELTLYVIDLKKENEKMQAIIIGLTTKK